MPKMSLRSFALSLSLVLLSGCGDPPVEDPLSDEAIEDVVEDEGDAQGDDWSGIYSLTLDQTACDCPTVAGQIDLCEQLTAGNRVDVEVAQSEGYLQIMLTGYQLAGPVEQSGAFLSGGLFDLTTVVTTGNLAVRLDGQFSQLADTAQLDGTLKFRIDVTFGEEAIVCERSDRATGPRQAAEPMP